MLCVCLSCVIIFTWKKKFNDERSLVGIGKEMYRILFMGRMEKKPVLWEIILFRVVFKKNVEVRRLTMKGRWNL